MRTRSHLIALLALLGILMAACGGNIETKPLVVVSETATTRTIEHTFGTTEIPTNPQRVIALGEEGMLADLLDAGHHAGRFHRQPARGSACIYQLRGSYER